MNAQSTNVLSFPQLQEAEENVNFILTKDFVLREVEDRQEKHKQYLLRIGTNNYYVGIYIYQLLLELKSGATLRSVIPSLNKLSGGKGFTLESVAELVNDQLVKIFQKESNSHTNPVKSLFQIVKPKKIVSLLMPLSKLFDPRYFRYIFSIAILFSFAYWALLKQGYVAPANGAVYTSFDQNFIFFGCLIMFLIFHEIGHAAAATAFGHVPEKIGFGIYFIFPAFYTDLTDTWALTRQQRITINLAGIYFQLLVNVVLISLIAWGGLSVVGVYFVKKFIYLNIIICLYNTNPFFRFDGYWIYSDYFNLPNLRNQSRRLMLNLFLFVRAKISGKDIKYNLSKLENYPLAIYTILYFLFMGFIWFFIVRLAINSHYTLYTIWQDSSSFSSGSVTSWSTLLPPMIIAGIFWTITFLRVRKRFVKKPTSTPGRSTSGEIA